MNLESKKTALEQLYRRYNRREWVRPDPLQFLYDYQDCGDREIAGLIAALLAYGRIRQILSSVGLVLGKLSPEPRQFLLDHAPAELRRMFTGFKHRFATGEHLAELLIAIRGAIRRHGSLAGCFAFGLEESDTTTTSALVRFVGELDAFAGGRCGHLLADPAKGSACKRYHLYLRWMARRDAVDPGGWDCLCPSKLIVPLDIHMHRIARSMGATERSAADGRTALEVTEAFRRIRPDDPVRYDFALTRLGINPAAEQTHFRSLLDNGDGDA